MELTESLAYAERGLDQRAQRQLSLLGDLILNSGFNVTGVAVPREIERMHFLDSLSLLDLQSVGLAERLADVGSGAGLPALVLALALPTLWVVAVESRRKKCDFMERAAALLSLDNVEIRCVRAEDHGRKEGREFYDVAVSRAVAALPVVAELSVPLLRMGGSMVAMKGTISDQERTQGELALGILGCEALEVVRLHPFVGAESRFAYVGRKTRATPDAYPRRAGVPGKRPLGR